MASGGPDMAEFSKAQFDEAYKRALERKRLFKEYLTRHQVMEKLNGAIEKLFECERLPENPMEFIAECIVPGAAGVAAAGGSKGSAGAGPAPTSARARGSLTPKLTGL